MAVHVCAWVRPAGELCQASTAEAGKFPIRNVNFVRLATKNHVAQCSSTAALAGHPVDGQAGPAANVQPEGSRVSEPFCKSKTCFPKHNDRWVWVRSLALQLV